MNKKQKNSTETKIGLTEEQFVDEIFEQNERIEQFCASENIQGINISKCFRFCLNIPHQLNPDGTEARIRRRIIDAIHEELNNSAHEYYENKYEKPKDCNFGSLNEQEFLEFSIKFPNLAEKIKKILVD